MTPRVASILPRMRKTSRRFRGPASTSAEPAESMPGWMNAARNSFAVRLDRSSKRGFDMDTPFFSRRALLKTGAGLAAATLIGGQARAADVGLRFARQAVINPRQRLLLKGGTIISMDARVGNLAKGDVLIEGTKISAVGANLNASGAQTIDASNMILIPGFIDCHRHSWEGQLRRINPNAPTLADYSAATHQSFAKSYRPHDMYVGNLITALGC